MDYIIVISIITVLTFLCLYLIYTNYKLKLSYKELQKNQFLQKTLIELIPDLVWLKDVDGRFMLCNKRFEKFLGATEKEIKGKTDYDYVPKELADLFRKNDLMALEQRHLIKNEEEVIYANDGHKELVETCKIAIYDENNNPIGVLGIARDISERKIQENQLKTIQSKLSSIVDISRAAIILIDKNLQVNVINNIAKEKVNVIYGKSIDKGTLIKDFFNDYEPQWNRSISLCFKGKTINVSRIYKLNNKNVYLDIIISPTKENGIVKWVTIFGRDITKYVEAKERVEQSENMLKLVMNSIPQSIFWKDCNSVYLGCNKNFAKAVGIDVPEKIKGKTDYDLPWKKDESDFFVKIDKEVMSNNKAMFNVVEKQKQYSGNDAWLETNKVPIIDRDNNVIGILGTFQDITSRKEIEIRLDKRNKKLKETTEELEQKNLELQAAILDVNKGKEFKRLNEELKQIHIEEQQLNEELLAANEQLYEQKAELEKLLNELQNTQIQLINSEKMASIGFLAASITHEINNPLNFICGGKTALEMYVEDNLSEHSAEIMPLLNMIETGVERASKIINSMNRFSRRTDKNDEECNIHDIIDDCLTMLQNKIKYKAEVIKDYSTDEYTLKGNEGKLHQVFLNILSNTEQAIEKNGKIKISTKLENGNVIVNIKDNGHGIGKDNLKKITEPFFTTKPSGKGTGLGLSIVSDIIREHNGTINYESEVGKGTTARVTFPVQ